MLYVSHKSDLTSEAGVIDNGYTVYTNPVFFLDIFDETLRQSFVDNVVSRRPICCANCLLHFQ